MNGNNINGNNVNISNSIGTQFSPASQLLNGFSEKQAEQAGRKIAESVLKGIEQGFKNTRTIEKALTDLSKSIDKSVAKAKKSTDKAFNTALISEYNKQLKTSHDLTNKLHTTEILLQAEIEKEIPNEQEVIRLKKEQIKAETEAKVLLATQEDIIRRATIEKEKQLELAKDEASQDKRKIDNLTQEWNTLNGKITETTTNIKKAADESIKALEEANKKTDTWATQLKEKFDGVSDTIKTVTNAIDSYLDLKNVDNAINAWTQSLDSYTKLSIETGQAFSTGYANTPGFQSFKNDVINAFTDDGLRGIYDKDQLMNGLKELANMGFQNSTVAKDMARDIQFAREYLGISSTSMKDLYELEVRTGDDTFLKKSLNAVISLQKAGNVISQDHLNAMLDANKSMIEKLMDLGMSAEAAGQAQEQLLAIQNAYDATYGQGTGQAYVNSLMRAMSPDNLGANFQDAYLATQQIKDGSIFGLMNNFNNSPATQSMLKLRENGDSMTNFMIGSDANFGDSVNSNLAYRLSGKEDEFNQNLQKTMEAIDKGTAVEDAMKSVQETISEDMKIMNDHMQNLLEKPWDKIADSLHESKFASTAISRLNTFTNMITSSLALLVVAINANTAAQGASAAGDAIGDVANVVSGKGKGIKGLFSTLKGTSGTKMGNLIGKVNSNPLVKTGAILAGIQATSSMVKDGMSGLIDPNTGESVGTSFGDRAAAVFGGSEIKEEGKNVGSSGLDGLGKGAAVGAAIGTIIPGIGTVVGGVVGGAIGGLAGLISGIHKDNKAKELEKKKREEENLAYSKATAANTLAIKNQRDMALMSRFSDDRYGTNPAGAPPIPMGSAPSSSSVSKTDKNGQLGVGGEWNGIDIDGFKMTSPFDPERPPIWIEKDQRYTSKGHYGIDFAASMNKELGAAYDGIVEKVVTGNSPTGEIANYVILNHPDKGIKTRYYHLAKAADGLDKMIGKEVKAGQLIGYVGHSGQSTAPHLHYDLTNTSDPTNYVTSDIFYPGATAPSSNGNSSKQNSIYSRDAAPVNFSYIPEANGYGSAPAEYNGSTTNTFSSPSIEEKLDILNNTLIAMGEKQDNQQKLLDALTNSPIYNLGV